MEAQQFSSGIGGEESSFTSDDRVSSLFQPDTLLSTQYFENLRRKTLFDPEKRLMLAILEDGIFCYLDNLHATGSKKRRLFEDAAAWIVESDGDWVFSFESVCDALGLKPQYVRQGLLRWKEKGGDPRRRLDAGARTKLAG
jgi:hypothetical protein